MTQKPDQAILLSLAYAHFFRSPLTFARLRRFLITSTPINATNLRRSLNQLQEHKLVASHPPFYHLPSLEPSILTDYHRRQSQLPSYLHSARRLARFLSFFPNINLVCLTGSVAAGNPQDGDDLDLLIVTSAHTLWLTRLLITPIFILFFHKRHPSQSRTTKTTTCLNLWLDSDHLLVPGPKQSLYSAYELAMALPILDRRQTHQRLLAANSFWAGKLLANAYSLKPHSSASKTKTKPKSTPINPLNLLNRACFFLQLAYMKPKMTTEYITLHQAFFHPYSPENKLNSFLSTHQPDPPLIIKP